MTYTIHKGYHRARWWFKDIKVWRQKTSLSYRVMFGFNTAYDLHSDDNADVNKLFGIGYFWNHKTDSVRFGWNFNRDNGRISLFAFTHVNGVMDFIKLCDINRGVWYDLSIEVMQDRYYFGVNNAATGLPITLPVNFVKKTHHKHWCYLLHPLFGGNQPAPHLTTIEMIRRW
jgi:hypothetical protein